MPEKKYTPLTGFNIANVECVKLVTRETQPTTYVFKTTTKFTAEPKLEEGQEVAQRVKNTVMGRIKTDDLLSGYKATAENTTPPQQYLVYTTQTYEDEHWDDANRRYRVYVYLNLWGTVDPTEVIDEVWPELNP